MPFDFRARPVRQRVWTAGRLLVLAAALAVTFGVFFLASMRVATRAREVAVPDVRGKSIGDAKAAMSAVGLVMKVDAVRRADPKVPADHILTQEPEPGTVLRRQRAVRVRASEGQREPVVSPVVGKPERTAELALADDHVTVSSRAEIQTSDYPAGSVVAQDPLPKSRATSVTLLVNRGEAGQSYVMPDLIGTLGLRSADILRTLDFRVTITGEAAYPGVPPGVIIKQTPAPGFQVARNAVIALEVSR
jgi:eukaryotic-like serine/threonine-protein kinase